MVATRNALTKEIDQLHKEKKRCRQVADKEMMGRITKMRMAAKERRDGRGKEEEDREIGLYIGSKKVG